jgi:hypothetical protein
MGPFLLAWLAGEGIIIYRSIKVQGGPPWPGQLLAGTGAFAALAVLAEAGPGARRAALTIAWGLNAAGFLALFQVGQSIGVTNAMSTLTGTNPQNSGWWAAVTDPSRAVSDTMVLPASGGCTGAGTGTTDPTTGCPPGQVKSLSDGKCYPVMAAALTTPPATTQPGGTVLV